MCSASGPARPVGAWGGIAAGIFGSRALGGIGGISLGAQVVGTLAGIAVALIGSAIVYGAIKAVVGLRLDAEQNSKAPTWRCTGFRQRRSARPPGSVDRVRGRRAARRPRALGACPAN